VAVKRARKKAEGGVGMGEATCILSELCPSRCDREMRRETCCSPRFELLGVSSWGANATDRKYQVGFGRLQGDVENMDLLA
jgi:hypothetical protein